MPNENQLEIMRHSLSHVLAQAILQIYPHAKLGMGPAIEDGFYYDFDLGQGAFKPEDLADIEKRMRKIIKEDQKFEQYSEEIKKSIKYLEFKNQPYKVELAKDLEKAGEKNLSFYRMINKRGEKKFVDMCIGPHVGFTKKIGAFKLTKIAGAYWKGDEKNIMMQRIYGVAFASAKELDDYLEKLRQAELRNHKKLGQELDLFIFSELVGPGLPIYTFRGALLRQLIIDYSDELQKKIGYQKVHTPNMNKGELFKVSGHYDKYKDSMFLVKSNYTEEEYFLKPMNCPQHTQVYSSKQRSYKDLPIRIADFANLYRDEKPGELNGLARLRCFCQDDAHCFCREDQIENEFAAILSVIKEALKTYGMSHYIRLSLRDENNKEKYIGEDKVWEKSQKVLEDILKKNKINYVKAEGEAAFYGPKMDIMTKDSIDREWQISTIQLDFSMPKRFNLVYIDTDGKKKTPVMIHRALVGSPERFMAILIEHYAGNFPVWLAPVQVQLIPVSQDYLEFAKNLNQDLVKQGIRSELDEINETVGYKIRKAEKLKIPYMLVIGEKEAKDDVLNVRKRGEKEVGSMKKGEFVKKILEEIKNKN